MDECALPGYESERGFLWSSTRAGGRFHPLCHAFGADAGAGVAAADCSFAGTLSALPGDAARMPAAESIPHPNTGAAGRLLDEFAATTGSTRGAIGPAHFHCVSKG